MSATGCGSQLAGVARPGRTWARNLLMEGHLALAGAGSSRLTSMAVCALYTNQSGVTEKLTPR